MLPEEAHWLATTITNCPRAEQILLNRLAKNIMYCVVTIYITLHYITSHYITLHFWAFLRFFSRIYIFSRLYNLPPRQAFWSSRRPDSLAITYVLMVMVLLSYCCFGVRTYVYRHQSAESPDSRKFWDRLVIKFLRYGRSSGIKICIDINFSQLPTSTISLFSDLFI